MKTIVIAAGYATRLYPLTAHTPKPLLEIGGKSMSSEELAALIYDTGLKGISRIQFVIGGSIGLSDEIINRADLHLSFSKMTFPHQLMRVVLLEQIYRCFKINAGEPYHK